MFEISVCGNQLCYIRIIVTGIYCTVWYVVVFYDIVKGRLADEQYVVK